MSVSRGNNNPKRQWYYYYLSIYLCLSDSTNIKKCCKTRKPVFQWKLASLGLEPETFSVTDVITNYTMKSHAVLQIPIG